MNRSRTQPDTLVVYMDVSKHSGTPKSSILIGFSIINHPFWGTPIFGNTHIYSSICPKSKVSAQTRFTYLGPPGEALPKRLFGGGWLQKKAWTLWVKVNDIVPFTWLVVSKIFYVHPYFFGKISNLTNIFQRGWFNHQLVYLEDQKYMCDFWGNRSGTFFSTMRTKRQLGCPVGSGWING